MNLYFKNPLTLPAAFFLIALVSYGIFELFRMNFWQLPETPETLIEESLDKGEEVFRSYQAELIDDTSQLLQDIIQTVGQQQNRQLVNRAFSEYDFFGAVLYRDELPWSWDGFHLAIPPLSDADESATVHTFLQTQNNLALLIAKATFSINESSYQLVTAKKLSHTTNLPISSEINFDLANYPPLNNYFPVYYSFSQPPTEDLFTYRNISTTQSDSVGIVYAQPQDFEQFKTMHAERITERQNIFHILMILTLFILFIVFAIKYKTWGALLFQIGFISLMWFLAIKFSVPERWGMLYLPEMSEVSLSTQLDLAHYLMNSLFLMLFSLVAINTVRGFTSLKSDKMQLVGTLLSFLYGIAQLLLILFFVISTKELTAQSTIPLMDLDLLPQVTSLIFYIAGALFFTAITGISLAVSRFLFKYEGDKGVVIFLSSFFAFIITFFGIDQITTYDLFIGWQFLLIMFLFTAFICTGWLMARFPEKFITMSGFRRMMILLLVTTGSMYFIILNTYTDRGNRELLDVAMDYYAESESSGEAILYEILNNVETQLQETSEEEIFVNPDRIQARFERIVDTIPRSVIQNYNLDLHLVRSDGNMISDYSTSIESPDWSTIFDFGLMSRSYSGEQLRSETNRPIIWGRPPGIGENFLSFNRGWIPLYDISDSRNIIAWITGSIYQERPDFNKPIRAVMAATTSADWRKSFYMAEFIGNRVVRSAIKGIYTDQPEYNRLSEIERTIALQDSLAFITTKTSQGEFREVLLRISDQNIIKVSTPKPGFSNHLFSFFRLFLPLLFFGLFIMAILSIFELRSFHLFSQSKRFQNRLIDGFTLAALLFLTVLIFATQYAISNQSEKNIERDLVQKIKNLGETVQLSTADLSSGDFNIDLGSVTSPLNVDAILYKNLWVAESTTPQIFQQFLVPQILPFTAYEFIYNRERRHIVSTVELGSEELMVGYRAILNEDNQPIGAIAIPTFTHSPVYTEQLLQTTSYLFGIYLVIFFMFTIGALIYSNHLTKPLELIQKGLNKISRGEQKTKIPVTSRDEVGSLAKAYNQMVKKLDEAQKELIKAERESAWKEMAQQVAHEIKNPLTPMKLNLQHLQRQLEANPENVMDLKPAIEKTAENIIEQIESLNKIASDFSKFSKPIQAPLEPTDLKTLIESVAELYKHEENVDIKLEFRNGDLTLNCVDDELRRVLINLVKNSIEASTGNGLVIEIKADKRSDNVFITVSDNGVGIPKENQENIFVPNFSTKSSGTGLGLAITKKIIDAHNGIISFESSPGNGATFIIQLPLNHSDY